MFEKEKCFDHFSKLDFKNVPWVFLHEKGFFFLEKQNILQPDFFRGFLRSFPYPPDLLIKFLAKMGFSFFARWVYLSFSFFLFFCFLLLYKCVMV